jgi:hypothetical protein
VLAGSWRRASGLGAPPDGGDRKNGKERCTKQRPSQQRFPYEGSGLLDEFVSELRRGAPRAYGEMGPQTDQNGLKSRRSLLTGLSPLMGPSGPAPRNQSAGAYTPWGVVSLLVFG